ncbi:DUF6541 family protein [Brachybacterium epidermidis]|uniref:DUF6541 family protein n=1 Tax=Brachybacterium epidermidis TaxID=2781983 RepID=UPI00398F2C99
MGVGPVLATILAVLAVLSVPAAPIVIALRLRPLTAVAFLAPVSMALIAAGAELGHVLRLPWTPATPVLLGVLLGAILWLPGRSLAPAPSTPHDPAPDDLTPVQRFFRTSRGCAVALTAGLLLGAGLLTVQALRIMGSIHAVNQTYDNVFHLNAVRHILRSGDASAWVVGGMTRLEGDPGFYPALWHQTVSLAVQVTGLNDIVLTANVMVLAMVALVWPLAAVALVRVGTGAGPVGWFLAGPLAGISVAYPLTLIGWGVVLPYMMSLTVMPLVVLVVAHVAGVVPPGAQRLSLLQLGVLTPLLLTAAALAHPQSVFVGIVLCVPILLWGTGAHVVGVVRRRDGATVRLAVAAVFTVIAVVGTQLTWTTFRPGQSSAVWKPNTTRIGAIGQVASLSPNATLTWEPLGLVMLAAVLGVLIWSRSRWLLVAWIVGSALSVMTRSEPPGDLRYLLTGNWYSDNNRISAIPIIVAVPVLAVGMDALARRAARYLPVLQGPAGVAAAAALAAGCVALSALSPSNESSLGYQQWEWQSTALLSADERELLEHLPEVVPEDAVIATNAWNGSSLAYAISDRPVLNTYMGFAAEPEVHLLNARLDEANTVPEVCDAAEELDVEFALDFGPQEIHGRNATYTGLNEISETGAAEVVMQVGEAKLLRMLPCRGVDGQLND